MKESIICRIFLLFPVIFLLFSCPEPEHIDQDFDEWYKYDPRTAAAEIIQSMDITESFEYNNTIGEVRAGVHDIAVHGDFIYIRNAWFIQIYDKNTMEYIRTVEMDLKQLPIYGTGRFGGLVVTDDFVLILVNTPFDLSQLQWPPNSSWQMSLYNHPHFLLVDLDTGCFEIVNAEEALGIPLKTSEKVLAGFDKENGLFWVRQGVYNESIFYFYHYNKETASFVFHDKKNGFAVGDYWSSYHAQAVTIHGSTVWSGYIGDVWNAKMEKRDIDDPQKYLHVIDINYLGLHKHVLNLPTRFAFDGEHIYLTVIDLLKGNYKVKLLKIQPKKFE